jgi:hypothetical protein
MAKNLIRRNTGYKGMAKLGKSGVVKSLPITQSFENININNKFVEQIINQDYDISGISNSIEASSIKSVASFIQRSYSTSKRLENPEQQRNKEAKELKIFITENNLWFDDSVLKNYLDEGAEQKVYYIDNNVIKLNDAGFYSSWVDYFVSLLLHNYYFPQTKYKIVGFLENDNKLYLVVKQNYVKKTTETDLSEVKEFMSENGFVNTRNNDYINKEIGIILEDLHEENVLTKDGILYFIDTVFYYKEKSYSDMEISNLELAKGSVHEEEHRETLEKVASGEISVDEAITQTAKTHIVDDPNYYEKLEEMENKTLKLSDIPNSVKQFMPEFQQKLIIGSVEHWDILKRLESIIDSMPKVYGTDNIKSEDKIIQLHYFYGSSDWYIVEKDSEVEQLQAYGYAVLNGDYEMAEWGYINLEEIKSSGKIELDFFWDPKKFSELEFNKTEENPISKEAQIIIKPEFNKMKEFIEQTEKEIKPVSTLIGQDKINSEIRILLKSKGLNRYLYTKSDFNLLSQYTGDSKTQEEKSDGYLWDYFTPDEAVKLCWQLAYKYGFRATESKRICEPASGSGRFLRYAPDYCQVTAYEIDETSYMICKLLYPNFNIINKSFESAFYVESGLRGIAYKPVYDTYNLVIGNPPYMYPYTSVYKDKEKIVYPFIQSLEQLFIIRGVDSLEKNGLLIYIIPASIIDNNSSYQEFKDALFKKCVMLDAIRLPSGTFKGTDITTDIIVVQKR